MLTLNFNSLRDLLRWKQRVSGPPWISTWNWPTAKQSVAALARLDPQVLAPGHGTPMANATAAELRALAESLNVRQKETRPAKQPRGRARAEGRRAHGSVNRLADAENPLVQQTAARLSQGCQSSREQVERLVSFVRDDIKFGFPPAADWTSASQTLQLGIGQCNTKGTLLLALCDAAGIPARLHFAPIRRSIQRGLYTGPWYLLLPRHLSHSWLEADVDGR